MTGQFYRKLAGLYLQLPFAPNTPAIKFEKTVNPAGADSDDAPSATTSLLPKRSAKQQLPSINKSHAHNTRRVVGTQIVSPTTATIMSAFETANANTVSRIKQSALKRTVSLNTVSIETVNINPVGVINPVSPQEHCHPPRTLTSPVRTQEYRQPLRTLLASTSSLNAGLNLNTLSLNTASLNTVSPKTVSPSTVSPNTVSLNTVNLNIVNLNTVTDHIGPTKDQHSTSTLSNSLLTLPASRPTSQQH